MMNDTIVRTCGDIYAAISRKWTSVVLTVPSCTSSCGGWRLPSHRYQPGAGDTERGRRSGYRQW